MLRETCAIGGLSHCRQPPASSEGQLCHVGTHRPCRCRGWRCRSHRRAASPRQEHADLLSVSPRQAQRHPPGCSRHHWGLWHRHPGRISLLRTRGTRLGAPAGAWWVLSVCPPLPNWAVQCPAVSPCPVTPVHAVFLLLGAPGATVRGGVTTWAGREQGELCTRGGAERGRGRSSWGSYSAGMKAGTDAQSSQCGVSIPSAP